MEVSRRAGLLGLAAATIAFAGGRRLVRAQEQAERLVAIGTGGVTSTSYPVGGAICRLVNANRAEHGIRCAVEATAGPAYSLTAIAQGGLDLAIVSSDWQFHAFHGGTDEFPEPDPELRALFSVQPEPLTVLARADSGIRSFPELIGHRVNVGARGSNARATLTAAMVALDWTMADFAVAGDAGAAEQAAKLCGGEVDAVVYTVAHPSGLVQQATSDCDSRLLPVAGAAIDRLLAARPFYSHATIPGGLYAGNPGDVASFGTKATVVASTRVPDDIAYAIVAAVFDDFADFTRLHPVLAQLNKDDMVGQALSAPLHAGAARYFEQAGLL